MQTTDGPDTASLRWDNRSTTGIQVKVEEEQSRDSETTHTSEVVGYFAFGSNTPDTSATTSLNTSADTDQDGLTDNEELEIYGTNPNDPDTDRDGITDGKEVAYWGSQWNADIDGDGIINLLDPDSDGDNYLDGDELAQGYDPADPTSNPSITRINSSRTKYQPKTRTSSPGRWK